MKNELKQELTRRLSECNNGGLIIVMYDIYFAFSADVKCALNDGESDDLKKSIGDVQASLDELIGALDFSYSIASQLFSLYCYCKRLYSTALYKRAIAPVDEAESIMKKLLKSFEKVAAEDKSESLMSNTQKVYAGITYGRTQLNENCIDDNQRGFLA